MRAQRRRCREVHASDAGEVEHNGVEIVLVGDRCSDQPLDTRDRGEPQHPLRGNREGVALPDTRGRDGQLAVEMGEQRKPDTDHHTTLDPWGRRQGGRQRADADECLHPVGSQ